MGKGSALLLLLGLVGLLLAIPRALRKESGAGPVDSGASADAESAGAGSIVTRSAKSRPDPPRIVGSVSRVESALMSSDPAEQQLALDSLLPDLMERDIAAAAALAEKLPAWARRERSLLMVSDRWARSDPASAHRWASDLKKQEERKICLAAIWRQAGRHEHRLAIDLAESSPERPDPELLEHLAANLLTGSRGSAREEVVAWMIHKRDPQVSDRLLAAGVRLLAETEPGEAASIAVDYMRSGPLLDEAVISALHQWVLKDPKAAAEWVRAFPESPLRQRALGELPDVH